MRQVIVDGSRNPTTVIHIDKVHACGVAAGGNDGQFAGTPTQHSSGWKRAAPLCIVATLLASTWASQASGGARQAQMRSGDDRSIQLAQATSSEPNGSLPAAEQERQRAEKLTRELAVVRHDIETLQARLKEAGQESARARQAADSEIAELRKSLQREREGVDRSAAERSAAELRKSMMRERSERMERDIARMRGDPDSRASPPAAAKDEARQATDSGVVELKRSLQQERERSGRLEQDLAAARREVETQTALVAKARTEATEAKQAGESGTAKLQKSVQEERERATRLEQDLTAARQEVEAQSALAAKARAEAVEAKQKESGTAELQKSLQEERERAARLEQDLMVARREVETKAALAARAYAQATAAKQEGDSGAAELQKSAQEERDRAGRLEQDLAAARREVETQTALVVKVRAEAAELKQAGESGTAELQKSVQEERARAARLEQDLTVARREVETQAALAAKAYAQAAEVKQAGKHGTAELQKSLQKESERAVRLEQELALARSTKEMPVAGQVAQAKQAEPDAAKPVAAETVTVANARGESPANPEDAQDLARLVARASVLLGQGDIGSARIVLERAAETGNAQASFMLAETYDPLILPQWGTYGTRGDAMKARTLYAKAEAGGVKEAKQRFDALRQ
jgi:hypothetical protein